MSFSHCWIGRLSLTNDDLTREAESPTSVGISAFVKISVSIFFGVLSSWATLDPWFWIWRGWRNKVKPSSSGIDPRNSSDFAHALDVIDKTSTFFLGRRLLNCCRYPYELD
ncbi:uncharacterized protein K444DRAFT_35098 [Hyaloscypha bicolor E]|uniref:Uncharacterized protein n=1 Tax=Hyaloscypha bicolor E TaxID=1095630 RepID=A0A2J6T183_9HELO|nr:uncharacterized protein K444DRAFT_35098 [Hyaloscypha bicolor E]PMD56777.1 hypothetical protein K444DRAFT_35098 [Hyaloscypha bicolor E]